MKVKFFRLGIVVSLVLICGSLLVKLVRGYDFTSPTEIIENIGTHQGGPYLFGAEFLESDSLGNLYVGDKERNQIHKYNVGTSTWTVIYNYNGDEYDEYSLPDPIFGETYLLSGVDIDDEENIYVSECSNYPYNRIKKLSVGTTTWQTIFTNLDFCPSNIKVANDGGIFVKDNSNRSRVRKYDIGSTTWVIFDVGETGSEPDFDIDTSNNNIFVVNSPGNQFQTYDAGTTKWTVYSSQGTGPGDFVNPYYISYYSNRVFISDLNGYRSQKYDIGATTWTVLNNPAGVLYFDDVELDVNGNAYAIKDGTIYKNEVGSTDWTLFYGSSGSELGEFNSILGFDLDNNGNISITDHYNDRIQKYDIGTTTWTVFKNIQFPVSITFDTLNNIYYFGHTKLYKENLETGITAVLGISGTSSGMFGHMPNDIYADNTGNIYVADTSNNRIQKYDIGTTTWTVFGDIGIGVGQFRNPKGVVVDNNGNIYVADTYNHRIQRYDIGTTTWTVMGSGGTGVGQFLRPWGISIDNNGNIYVADTDNDRIQKYDIGTSTWSAYGSSGEGEGQFRSPTKVKIDDLGNVYVLDYYNNRIQKIIYETPTPTVTPTVIPPPTTPVINFTEPTEIIENIGSVSQGPYFYRPGSIVTDSIGNIYVAEYENHRIQKYDIGTTTWVVMGSEGTGVGQFDNPDGVAVDTLGNIYVADTSNHRIQKYDVGTTTWVVMGSSGSELGQFNYPHGIAVDTQNNIYVSDSDNDRIQKYDVETTTWSSFLGDFNYPRGLSVDSQGNIYVTDTDNNRIQKYDIGTTTWVVMGSSGSGIGEFLNPSGVTIDTIGNIYVADTRNNRIQKYNIGTSAWTVMGSGGLELGQFYFPSGINVDTQGNIYVTETMNDRIQKYDIGTTTWISFGSSGLELGQFYHPRGTTIDSQGNIYVTDTNNHRVQKYNIGTSAWTVIGSGGTGVGQFDNPHGITVDTRGNVYVTENNNNRVQKYNIGTSAWTVIGSGGTGVGQFDNPHGITVDTRGNVFVADNANGRVQKYDIGTTTWTVMGSGITDANGFGPRGIHVDSQDNIYVTGYHWIQKYNIGTTTWTVMGSGGTGVGQFSYPDGITVDTQENIYVVDSVNHRIQKYDVGTTTWTAFGSFGTGEGQFHYPSGISFDTLGNIYVVDTVNHRIQKFVYETAIPTVTPTVTPTETPTPTPTDIPIAIIGTEEIPGLINSNVFSLPAGESTTSASIVLVNKELFINVGEGSTLATVNLAINTEITKLNSETFDVGQIAATIMDKNNVSNLAPGFSAISLLQWGIPEETLVFSNPVYISIYVGPGYDGRRLNVLRSLSLSSGWTTDGLVTTSCVLADGYCNFVTNKASYFTVVDYQAPSQNQSSSSSSSPSSSGGSSYSCNDIDPKVKPDLFELRATKGKAKLFFSPSDRATTYAVLYGFKKGDERFGTIVGTTNNNIGVQKADILALNPRSTYYFKVAAINGCTIGPWSDWVPIKADRVRTVFKYKTVIIKGIKNLVNKFLK